MKWISIKDRLPEVDKDVLLLTDSGVTSGSRSSKDYEEWSFITLDCHGCGCCGGSGDKVTHWQELPKAPSKKQ